MHANQRRVRRGVFALVAAGLAATVSCTSEAQLDAPDEAASVPLPPVTITRDNALGAVELFIHTYEGSNQTVEPDVVFIPGGWHGFEYWMTINPYDNGDDLVENASMYASHDGIVWITPDSLVNPVIPRPTGEIMHNSDPDLVFIPDPGRLVLFDRSVTATQNLLRQTWSDDGVHWSAPVTVLSVPRHQLVSPSIALVAGHRARLWYVDTGAMGCDSRNNTVRMRHWTHAQSGGSALLGSGWSQPVATDLQAPAAKVIWHVDVIWVPERKEYWAIFPAHGLDEPCAFNDLYVARSRDGLKWTTLPEPLIRRGVAPFAQASVYRASMVYDAPSGNLKVWFSSLANGGSWHLGYGAFPVADLSAALDARR